MPAEPQRDRLPFEPSKKRQKPAKNTTEIPETVNKPDTQAQNLKKSENKSPETANKFEKTPPSTREEMAVPAVVSNRMARRIAVFCGVPTVLGMTTFIVSYFIVSHQWLKLPNVAVLLVSMGFFGLAVLGLTYGLISASWDEEIVGSKLGWREFTTNWGRIASAWRSTRQKKV